MTLPISSKPIINKKDFELNQILERDSYYIDNLKLCQIRLMDNSNYPWIILVPTKPNLVEITDLNDRDFDLLNQEIKKVAKLLQKEFNPDKLNIANIGNIVSQLHVHVIARFKHDKLFPKTVWGSPLKHYDDQSLKEIIEILRKNLALV